VPLYFSARCRPLGGRFFTLVILESSSLYRSHRPSCFMRLSIAYALPLVVDVVGDLRFSPTSVLLLADKLAGVLMDILPAKYFFGGHFGELRAA
jgi:hypothetical protein